LQPCKELSLGAQSWLVVTAGELWRSHLVRSRHQRHVHSS